MSELETGDSEIRKVDGRSREARLARNAAAAARTSAPQQETPRAREPDLGRVAARGRDGAILTRSTVNVTDEFDVPAHMREKDWDLQWCTVSVAGDTDVALNMLQEFEANGWRPVPAGRFPGRFMKAGTPTDAAVIRKGQMLMERPMSLTLEAKAEDYNKAVGQMSDRDQSLMGKKANLRGAMPQGFEMGGKYRGTGGDLRMSIDRALDVPKPDYKLAEPGE